jgi:hypothetical protein
MLHAVVVLDDLEAGPCSILNLGPISFRLQVDAPLVLKVGTAQRYGVTIDHGAGAIKVISKDWIGTCPIV